MGGYDIFKSTLNPETNKWNTPVNVDFPINTPDDDIYYVLSANGEKGYYASGKQGGYGLKDIYLGVPVKIGKKGIEQIIELKLDKDEMQLLQSSAKSVKEVMNVLDNMGQTAVK